MSLAATTLALRGLGLPPAGGVESGPDTATDCMACGSPIARKERRYPWRPGRGTFTDWQYLGSQSGVCCAACVPFLENRLLMATQKCVINEQGAWKLSKDAHLAWFLRTPPEPPYVAVFSDAQKQHLLWKAAVTTDRHLARLQLGRASLSIDLPLLYAAVDWCAQAVAIARDAGRKISPQHPFARLDRERSDDRHGTLRSDVVELARSDRTLAALLDNLQALGEGELWGLAILAKQKIEVPLAEPLTFSTEGEAA